MNEKYWTTAECAEAWGVERETARKLMKRCDWQHRDVNGVRIVTVPIDTPKPPKGLAGNPQFRKKKETSD